jgi:hypothetical protein
MAVDTTTALSRRALIAGALGALGATAATALGRPLGVAAANTSITYVNDEDGNTVLRARSVRQPGFPSSGGAIGLFGDSVTESGVYGQSDTGLGVFGYAGSGTGVRGESASSRGGVFKGKRAQVRLLPADATTHPTSGSTGDLFVDKHHRLWFCRGGTSWHRLV